MTFYQFSISFLLLPNGKVSQEENLLREGVILNLHLCLPSKMYLFQAHTYTRHPFLTYGKSRGETRLIFQVVHLSLKSALPPYLNSHSQSFSSTDMRTPAWEWEHPLSGCWGNTQTNAIHDLCTNTCLKGWWGPCEPAHHCIHDSRRNGRPHLKKEWADNS